MVSYSRVRSRSTLHFKSNQYKFQLRDLTIKTKYNQLTFSRWENFTDVQKFYRSQEWFPTLMWTGKHTTKWHNSICKIYRSVKNSYDEKLNCIFVNNLVFPLMWATLFHPPTPRMECLFTSHIHGHGSVVTVPNLTHSHPSINHNNHTTGNQHNMTWFLNIFTPIMD